jgi:hypothetical protein
MTRAQRRALKRWFFGQINYEPSPGQWLLHEATERFIVAAAGARFGKSMFAGGEASFALLPYFEDQRIWIAGPQYELAEREFSWCIEFLGRFKFQGQPILQFARLSNADKGSRIIKFPWGSFCQTKSTDLPQGLLGEELDLLILAEASQIQRMPWERMLRARIGPRNGRVLACSTPNSDSGLFQEFYKNGLDPEQTDWKSFKFATIENPYFNKVEFETARGELDDKVFREQYLGEFVSRKGHVFALDRAHIFNDSTAPPELVNWSVVRSVQRGYQNPMVLLSVAIQPGPQPVLWVYQEFYKKQVLTADLEGVFKTFGAGHRIVATLRDDKDSTIPEELRKIGVLATSNSEKKYSSSVATLRRVQALQNLMRIKADGTTRLRIHENCKGLLDELANCKWPEAQREGSDRAEVELPTDAQLQAPKALSHVVAFIELGRGLDVYSSFIALNNQKPTELEKIYTGSRDDRDFESNVRR